MGSGAASAAGSHAISWAVAMLHTKNAMPIIIKALRLMISRIQAAVKTLIRLARANPGLGRAAAAKVRQMLDGFTTLFQKEGLKTLVHILAAKIVAMQTSAFGPATGTSTSTHPQTTSKKTISFQLFGTRLELSVSRTQPAQLATAPADTALLEEEPFIQQEETAAMPPAPAAAVDGKKLSNALAIYSKLDATPPPKTRPATTEADPSDTIPARRIC